MIQFKLKEEDGIFLSDSILALMEEIGKQHSLSKEAHEAKNIDLKRLQSINSALFEGKIKTDIEPEPPIEEISQESFIETVSLAEQTGGNIYNDIITLKNGKLIVISGDGIFIFKDEETYANGEELKSYIFE